MVTLTAEQINKFQTVIQFDLNTYLQNYSWFVDNMYPNIAAYFSGQIESLDPSTFTNLTTLIKQANYLDNIIYSVREKFDSLSDWFILDHLENIMVNLNTMYNTDKFARSPITNGNYGQNAEYQIILPQNDTLERLAIDQLGNINDWEDIALRNNLLEIDYSNSGCNTLNISKKDTNNTAILYLNSVVDNLQGEKLYGLDIAQQLAFKDDGTGQSTQDLNILSYEQTFIQACNILIQLKKGDIPEVPNMGIDSGLIGMNLGVFSYKAVQRQIQQTFKADDSIQNVTITNFSYQDGSVFFNFSVDSYFHLVYSNQGNI